MKINIIMLLLGICIVFSFFSSLSYAVPSSEWTHEEQQWIDAARTFYRNQGADFTDSQAEDAVVKMRQNIPMGVPPSEWTPMERKMVVQMHKIYEQGGMPFNDKEAQIAVKQMRRKRAMIIGDMAALSTMSAEGSRSSGAASQESDATTFSKSPSTNPSQYGQLDNNRADHPKASNLNQQSHDNQLLSVELLNTYIPDAPTTYSGSEIPLISAVGNIFYQSAVFSTNHPEDMNAVARRTIGRDVEEFCRERSLEQCNFIEQIEHALSTAGVNVNIPHYKVGNSKKIEADMTLMEKMKYPVLIIIRFYDVGLSFDGWQGREKLFNFAGQESWRGESILRANIKIDLVSSKSNEVIDRIAFNHVYKSGNADIAVKGLNEKVTTDTIGAAINGLLARFTNDFDNRIAKYDWVTLKKFIGKN